VFTTALHGRRWKSYLISADGGVSQPVLPGEQPTVETDPNWSPDGNSLVFWSGGTINIVDLQTHNVSVVPGSKGLWSPHWSPDGRYIAAQSSGDRLVTLFDFKSQKWTELARSTTAFPNWSRDGSYLHFHSFGNDPSLYRVRISDHKLEKIVSLKGTRLTIGPVGTRSGLAPDDSPLILRDVGSQEVYAVDLQFP
jgi:Tol biopolymer transport system component